MAAKSPKFLASPDYCLYTAAMRELQALQTEDKYIREELMKSANLYLNRGLKIEARIKAESSPKTNVLVM